MLSQGTKAQSEAWIQTKDGKRLEEHQILRFPALFGKPAYSQCFPECKEETEFEVHVKIVTPHDMNDSWWVRCYVDGQELDSHALTGRKYPATAVFKEFHTEEDDRIVAKALKFGPVPTVVDKEDAQVERAVLLGLGRIEVTLHRGRHTDIGKALPSINLRPDILVWEQDAKAKVASYAIGGSVGRVDASSRCHFTPIGPVYYKFHLNYRTRTKLQIMKIIDGDQSVEDQGKNPVNTVAKSSSKRKREERDPNVVYLLSDDEENGNATLGAGYNTKKRNKYLEEEVIKLRRQLKAKIVQPEETVQVSDSDED